MKNDFGIYPKSFTYIKNAFNRFPEISKTVIFGSRAMGNYKKGSDIDIAIFGENITRDIILKLSGVLNEELPIPYFVDVVHFGTIENNELKKHILEEGKIIYRTEQ